jgi:hypothetical protein
MKSCVNLKKSLNWLKHFAIDFAFDCLHVEEIEKLLCVILFVEIESKRQKKALKKERKRTSFEIFNQYRKNRSISNESDASLTQKVFTKKELFESTSNKRKTAFVVKKIVQIKSSTTISSLQVLQMLFR